MNSDYYITGWCSLRNKTLILNDKKEVIEENLLKFAAFIKGLYKKNLINYPKFYKMDNLSKLGFLTAELLIIESNVLKDYTQEEIGIVIANSSSSLDTDLVYQDTIKDKSNYFPSPSVFVYTLPNILIGEICIKHRIKGENAFLICKEFDPEQIRQYVISLLDQGKIKTAICGWVEILGENYESVLFIVEKKDKDHKFRNMKDRCIAFDTNNMYQLYKLT